MRKQNAILMAKMQQNLGMDQQVNNVMNGGNTSPQQGEGGSPDESTNPDGTRNHGGRRYKMVNGTWIAVQ